MSYRVIRGEDVDDTLTRLGDYTRNESVIFPDGSWVTVAEFEAFVKLARAFGLLPGASPAAGDTTP